MTLALTLTLRMLAGAPGDCHLVTNTRILLLPSCDVGPATIAALTEEPVPSKAVPPRPAVRGAQRYRQGLRAAQRLPVVRPDPALERRLEVEQQRRITAVARRVAAERERDAALGRLDAALHELEDARKAVAAARACAGRADLLDGAAAGRAPRATAVAGSREDGAE